MDGKHDIHIENPKMCTSAANVIPSLFRLNDVVRVHMSMSVHLVVTLQEEKKIRMKNAFPNSINFVQCFIALPCAVTSHAIMCVDDTLQSTSKWIVIYLLRIKLYINSMFNQVEKCQMWREKKKVTIIAITSCVKSGISWIFHCVNFEQHSGFPFRNRCALIKQYKSSSIYIDIIYSTR